jgi:hypothetical protein
MNDILFNQLIVLKKYKEDIIYIGTNGAQKKFLASCFIRYYLSCEKDLEFSIFPIKNIFTSGFKDDLIFANSFKKANFDIDIVINNADVIFRVFIQNYKNPKNVILKKNKNLNLNTWQYNHLLYLYNFFNPNKTKDEFNVLYRVLNEIYSIVEMNDNIHLGIPPIFNGVELFGSSVNTHNIEYCSPFNIEKIFGSLGSFFEYKFHRSGLYLCNPPFDEKLIEEMSIKLVKDLNETKHKAVVIISIPVWNESSQKSIDIKNYKMTFKGYDLLINSKYMMEKVILNKDDYKYWNYSYKKLVPSSHSHLIILSNHDYANYKKIFSLSNFMNNWKSFSANCAI